MGTITTEGKATRLVEYDRLVSTITFRSRDNRTSKSVKATLDDCEKFLVIMSDLGVKQDSFEAGNNSIEKDSFRDSREVVTERTVVLRTKYDLKLINAIFEVIEKKGFDADVDFSPECSNEKEIREELYKEASAASREEADRIATSLGMKIVGLEKMETDECYDYSSYVPSSGGIVGDICLDDEMGWAFKQYAKTKAQQKRIDAAVKAIWQVE